MEGEIRLLTTRQVAEQLGMHVETVRRLTKAGDLSVVSRKGSQFRFRQDAVDLFINNRNPTGTPEHKPMEEFESCSTNATRSTGAVFVPHWEDKFARVLRQRIVKLPVGRKRHS